MKMLAITSETNLNPDETTVIIEITFDLKNAHLLPGITHERPIEKGHVTSWFNQMLTAGLLYMDHVQNGKYTIQE